MTMTFKTFDKKSNHECVKRYLSANYVTCGCYGIYASDEKMKWIGDDPLCNPQTDSVYIDIDVSDDLLDWAVGSKIEPFQKKYVSESMIGKSNRICSAVERFSGAITITDEIDHDSKVNDEIYSLFMGDSFGRSSLTIFPDDLVDALMACYNMVIGDAAYSEAWLSMPLEVRKRHLTKDQTNEDKILWEEVWAKAYWKGEDRKRENKERWKDKLEVSRDVRRYS